jgi:protease IV
MKKRLGIFLATWLLLGGCVFVHVPLVSQVRGVEEQVVGGTGRAKIAVIDLSGVLSLEERGMARLSREPGLLPRFREELDAARADAAVVGVVLRIDSPGGSVTASDILYQEIRSFRQEKNVPVVVCIMDKGLSGGYYAALAADEILAHPTAVVGGVGVIAFRVSLADLLQKWGIEVETVQTGELKDFWSPLRDSRPEEMAIMRQITGDLQQRFLDLLGEHRQLSPDGLEQVASGRLYLAAEARQLGLIDGVGYLEEALARVRQLAQVDEARTIIYRRRGAYAENIYAQSPWSRELQSLERGMNELLSPTFRYQYLP